MARKKLMLGCIALSENPVESSDEEAIPALLEVRASRGLLLAASLSSPTRLYISELHLKTIPYGTNMFPKCSFTPRIYTPPKSKP